MKILLDTHCLIWLLDDAPALSATARRLILNASEVYFSSASIWEVGLKWRKGKIGVQPRAVIQAAIASGLRELSVSMEAMIVSCELKSNHGDPFDRLLFAQARTSKAKLMSADQEMRKLGANVIGV
jgi:PIN domain nuclease of toxin-antitoxin system